ncbi:FabD/lysophospholipase-like protein [Suhomyces tanzawaensis NRRL Y-17324]|uniref:Lysophospholipase n=1 Tax=Suhomyces tanzawaensis NRRL Y-17324 TaxID=984487 RepID=A0A1E4SMU9_9ASCO|nr:FabD/lysophospholipase-like protein [Suhomyces tanzawaensis NRRL Y-17324]ODV80849.1 FabD/lysophospholipase-like protein [Suhomyces tanzawaensis NRRL Y-17324]
MSHAPHKNSNTLWRRSYAPYTVLCPSKCLIRKGDMQLSQEEKDYIERRNNLTQVELKRLFLKNRIPDFDDSGIFEANKPIRIAIAVSGGGYRAMLLGAGILSAFDKRTPGSDFNSSGLDGLLQATSYLGGISGGSWLVMSNFVNDFRPIHELKNDQKTWDLHAQLLEGVPSFDPNKVQNQLKSSFSAPILGKQSVLKSILRFFGFRKSTSARTSFQSFQGTLNSTVQNKFSLRKVFLFYKELQIEVRAKRMAGFHLSLTDYWGRALVRRIFGVSARTPGATVTSCTNLPSFKRYEQPFPIIGTIQAFPNQTTTSKNSRLFEFTPFEFGSWDSYMNAFVPMKYLGSSLIAGVSNTPTRDPNVSFCISGFDNIGFITATSSSLFNHIFPYLFDLLTDIKLDFSSAISIILKSFGLSLDYKSVLKPQMHPDYALIPNPFYGFNTKNSVGKNLSSTQHMYLVDGGDDGQNILFQSFLVRAREIDIILAYDLTADVSNFPNGTTLYHSLKRFHNKNSSFVLPSFHSTPPNSTTTHIKSVFPEVPSQKQIVKLFLNQRPVFLGCDVAKDYPIIGELLLNSTVVAKDEVLPPLIVYTTNADYGYLSNTSTFQLSYTPKEILGMIQNGFNLATSSNSSFFAVCLTCAIAKRHWDRSNNNGTNIPSTCKRCFETYCWHKPSSLS